MRPPLCFLLVVQRLAGVVCLWLLVHGLGILCVIAQGADGSAGRKHTREPKPLDASRQLKICPDRKRFVDAMESRFRSAVLGHTSLFKSQLDGASATGDPNICVPTEGFYKF